MSDSFSDLWNSSVPSKPAPQKLGSVTPSINAPRRQQYDAFSILSSAGSSAPNSRPITPSLAGLSGQQSKPMAKPVLKQNSGDAFSDLLGPSVSGSKARMTIAQRAAQVEKERLEQMQMHHHHQQAAKAQPSAWDGLDNLAAPSSSKASSLSSSSINAVDDDWGFGTVVATPAAQQKAPPSSSVIDDEDWGLSEFSSSTSISSKPKAQAPQSRSQALWDLEEFSPTGDAASSLELNLSPSPPIPARNRSDSPGDFDFGNREDALLDNDSGEDDDDILGDLSKPVDAIPKRPKSDTTSAIRQEATSTPLPRPSSTQSSSRPVSPPPHILGQIVEMGFSIQQARVALASTDTGLDVQAALETLLANGAAASTPAPTPPRQAAPRRRDRERERERVLETPSPSGSQQEQRNIPDQADRLLAQASEIGLSVFSKASSFWKEGKEKVQKAYEERTAAATAGSSTSSLASGRSGAKTNGRPKWMQEAAVHDNGEGDGWKATEGEGGPIRYDDSPESSPRTAKAPPRPAPAVRKEAPPPAAQQSAPRVANLFADDAPDAYVSPFRRGKPKPVEAVPPAAAEALPLRSPSPIPITRRTVISASPASIAQSVQHKFAGGEKYKLGQYPAAEASYTSAIACLPAGHLLLVPLYNNRALARLKNGDYEGAIDDAGVVVEIVGEGFHPAREASVGRAEDGAGVNLGDGLVKALKRRAEAWEGREKWAEAGRDWEALAGKDWVKPGVSGDAVRGAGRCRRMVEAKSKADAGVEEAKPKPKPTARPSPRRQGPTPPSQALEELRAATNAAEAEDQAKHDLKDSVEARLTAWKGGKETNIRALIASLDTVLWPELGLQKVGLSELVAPNQVKIRYMKAIGKVHPDKLNASNSTLEQRMLANGVFGALNEAWNAFKQ